MNQAIKSFQQIWKQMDAARRRQAAEAFLSNKDYIGEQQRAAGLIAAKLNLRPQKAAKLPPEKSAGYLVSMVTPDEQLSGAMVRAFLFSSQEPMLTMFLNELSIPNDKGAISLEDVPSPETAPLQAAVEKINAAFDKADVDIYLSALTASDEGTWKNLPAARASETH